MRVLIFRTCSVPININNYNVQEIGLAKALIDSDNECDIIFFSREKNKKNDIIKYKNKIIKIYWMNGFNFFHHGIYKYDEILKIASKYDIVQCTDYNQIATYKMLKLSSKPVVIYHGPYKNKFSWKTNIIDYFFDLLYLKKMLEIQPHIICKSSLAEKTLHEKGFKNLYVVPVGLDTSRFHNVKNELVSQDSKNLLYIGQINKRRSIDFLLDVEKEIIKTHRNSKLLLIGKGPKYYSKHIQKRIEKENLIDNVIWIKGLKQEELCNYYKSSSVFLLPSNYEIFGMVLLEANYFNLPIISTLNGGSVSIIKNSDDGYIINGFAMSDWINKIEKVFNKSKKYKDFHNSWNDRVGLFLNIYGSLISDFKGEKQ